MDELYLRVVNALGALIAREAHKLSSEMSHPGADPDRSDDALKESHERLVALRRIRGEFENTMAGLLL